MDVDDALSRARASFSEGDVRGAVLLLEQCVEARPYWPVPRMLLSEIYRRIGDQIQAGRWGYLIENGATDDELLAFEIALVTSSETPMILAEHSLVYPIDFAHGSPYATRVLSEMPCRLQEAVLHIESYSTMPAGVRGFEEPKNVLDKIASPFFIFVAIILGIAALFALPALLFAMLV